MTRTPGGQVSLFGETDAAGPVPSGPPLCAWHKCGKPLHRGGVDGMHRACADAKARAEDPATATFDRVLRHWLAEFRRLRGCDPISDVRGDRVMLRRACSELVPKLGEARVLQLMTVALEAGASLGSLVNNPNRFVGDRPERGGHRRPVMQRAPPRDPPRLPDDDGDPLDLAGVGGRK